MDSDVLAAAIDRIPIELRYQVCLASAIEIILCCDLELGFEWNKLLVLLFNCYCCCYQFFMYLVKYYYVGATIVTGMSQAC